MGGIKITVLNDVKYDKILDMEKIEYKKPPMMYFFIKRLFDIICSIFALIILSPVMLITALCVKLEDGGPIIHKRRCICNDGDGFFTVYKFRSMKNNADDLDRWLSPDEIAEYKKEIKLKNDPRITKCGNFLRTFSIDELPQLVCILKGTMSFIGPRPIIEEEGLNYGDKLPLLKEAKPGLTGYWQVNGRSEVTYESKVRQGLELYYVVNRSLLLDAKIFFKTFKVVLSRDGAR